MSDGFVGLYSGQYEGVYSGDFVGAYSTAFSGTFSQGFEGAYSGTFSQGFEGAYSQGFEGFYSTGYLGEVLSSYTGGYTITYGSGGPECLPGFPNELPVAPVACQKCRAHGTCSLPIALNVSLVDSSKVGRPAKAAGRRQTQGHHPRSAR